MAMTGRYGDRSAGRAHNPCGGGRLLVWLRMHLLSLHCMILAAAIVQHCLRGDVRADKGGVLLLGNEVHGPNSATMVVVVGHYSVGADSPARGCLPLVGLLSLDGNDVGDGEGAAGIHKDMLDGAVEGKELRVLEGGCQMAS